LKTALVLLVLLSASALWLSCGSSSGTTTTTPLPFRVFLTQDVSGGNVISGVQIINAQKDVLLTTALISAGTTPGIMVVTPSRAQTLVFSGADNQLSFISNSQQTNTSTLTLPGSTESIVVSPDSSTAYVAVPAASIVGQQPGAVEVINLFSGAITAEIAVPAVHHLSIDNSGNRILGFSDNSDSVAVITPSNIGTGNPVVTLVAGFDRPVWAYFSSDDNTAYIVNCGAKCGGAQASVQKLDLTTDPPTPSTPAPVPAATVALVNGTTMYLAGTPVPASPCTGQTTQATSCGLLTIFDLTSMTVTNASDIVITDGYHNRIALGANGQLFVGAHDCTEIIPPIPPPQGAEVRGCLSIVNTQTAAVVIPPANGDATGLQPIAKRNVVYVVQGGELQIYDTTTDKIQKTQIDISGEAIDVKSVDF